MIAAYIALLAGLLIVAACCCKPPDPAPLVTPAPSPLQIVDEPPAQGLRERIERAQLKLKRPH